MRNEGYAVASLVMGIMSVLITWVPFLGLALAILGIIFAVKQRKILAGEIPCGIATAGLVLSIIGVCLAGLFNFFFLIGLLFA